MKKTPGHKRREKIYNIFSKNLELLKNHPKFDLKGEKTSGYICPLCHKIFDKNGLSKEYDDYLTLEDVPPKKLGGNVKLLTCKPCNNEQGSSLDKHLIEHLLTKDFFSGSSNIKRKARFEVDNKWNIGGTIHHTEEGGIKLLAVEGSSHEKHYQRLFKKGDAEMENIKVTIYGEHRGDRARVAKIRIAYLWLVSEFGYASLINPHMHVIREQIQNYDNLKYPVFGMADIDFPSEYEGVNLITKPRSLKSFAVAFTLETDQRERKFIVLLPGPSDPGLNIYDTLNELGQDGNRINIDLTNLDLQNVLNDPDRVYDYFRYWKQL